MADEKNSKSGALVRTGAQTGWRGDEHQLQVDAARAAGLPPDEVALDLYTKGFSAGIQLEDGYDGSIVARGRTVLNDNELLKLLRPSLRYLGVGAEQAAVKVHDGRFELRINKHAADATKPVFDAGKIALQVWIGFGLLGFAAGRFMPSYVTAIVWGIGLMLGAWQLRLGLASGRAMLGARLAMALGMLSQSDQLILPPEGDLGDAG